MRASPLFLLVAVAFLAAGALPVSGHAAPDPPEPMVRVLHDYNDDWGGDAGARPGHDLMALDLAERYNATAKGNVLVFRLSMAGGLSGDPPPARLRDVVTFRVGGETQQREFVTTDNRRFTGTFDAISGPVPLRKPDGTPDGQRFYVEGVVRWDDLGLRRGDRLSQFAVQGYADATPTDHMVGGFTQDGQRTDAIPPSEEASPASYRRSQYEVRGPVMYVSTQLDRTSVQLGLVDNQTVTWTLTNRLGRAQAVSVAATAPAGVSVSFHDGERYGENNLVTRLDPDASKIVHAYVLSAGSPGSGTLRLGLVTDLGGYVVDDVAVNEQERRGGGRGLPSTPIGLVLAALAFVAWRRR